MEGGEGRKEGWREGNGGRVEGGDIGCYRRSTTV